MPYATHTLTISDSDRSITTFRLTHQQLTRPTRVLSAIALAMVTACGGGGGSSTPAILGSATATANPTTTAIVAPAVTCYNGSSNNTLGAEDPFYVNSWHLKNTGPSQVVSAAINSGLAGIDANVENVHKNGKGCTGQGVTIAIVDSGLELAHEDIAANVLAGKSWNFATDTEDPSPAPNRPELEHGLGVAGVAAARGWNGKGSRGVAPFASLVNYLVLPDRPAPGKPAGLKTSGETPVFLAFGARPLADATLPVTTAFGNRADGVGVFNFSAGADYINPSSINDFETRESSAKYGTTTLRGGLGAVYFQSAGNSFDSMDIDPPPPATGRISVNCAQTLTADGFMLGGKFTNLAGLTCGSPNQDPAGPPYLYYVASMHNTGRASSYSSAGSSNWITGFGGESGGPQAAIISTDNSGCTSGFNNVSNKSTTEIRYGEVLQLLIADLFGETGSKDPNCNYTGTMNGTSAAAPSVSGVAALILEANPKLTWQDVGYIMAKTAKKVDPTIASADNAVTFVPNGRSSPWNLEDPWIVNTGGFNFQNRYGFGLVDADAAVQLAVAYAPPAGRRATPLVASSTRTSTAALTDKVGVNVASVAFTTESAVNGSMRVDFTVTNNSGADINPGLLHFEILNRNTKTKSILMPAFSSWYVGGKANPLKNGAQQQFRFHTNAFYGEPLTGDYLVYIVDFSGTSGAAGKALSFQPKLTSFSM